MPDDPSRMRGENPADGEYPLGRPDPERPTRELAGDPLLSPPAEEIPPKARFQFTLAEMFVLTIGVSVFLSLVASVPGGFATAYAAGCLGIGVLLARVVLWLVPSRRAIVYVGWWVTFGMYLLLCLAALVRGR